MHDVGQPQSRDRRATIAIALVLVSMACFALMDGLSKRVAGTVAIAQILLVRNLVFTAVCIALVRWERPGVPLLQLATSARPGLQLFRGLLLIAESSVFILSFKLMPLADAHAIAAASPLIVVALSALFLREPVGARRWTAVLIGFLGVLLIVRPGFGNASTAMLVPLSGALLWAIYQVLVRLASRSDSAATTSLWTALVGLSATAVAGPLVWIWPDPITWGLLLGIAVLGSAAHVTLIAALGMADASSVQPFTYTLFVWAVIVGYALYGDLPDAWTFLGAAVIIASGLYVWYRERSLAAVTAARMGVVPP